jgi:hypothetical protein
MLEDKVVLFCAYKRDLQQLIWKTEIERNKDGKEHPKVQKKQVFILETLSKSRI